MERDAKRDSPFACRVSALDDEQKRRRRSLLEHLISTKEELQELPDGYAFRFPSGPGMVRDVAEFITYERLCCPFFDFELTIEREGGPLWLRLRGRDGVKEFIRSELGV
jgi:hypothetical protein